MLDSAIIHRTGHVEGKPDLGRILETMLYYDRVHLLIGAPLMVSMWERWGPSGTRAVLDHPVVTATITPEFLGVHTKTTNHVQTYSPTTFVLAGRPGEQPKKKLTKQESLLMHLERTERGATHAEVSQVLRRHKISSYAKILGGVAALQNFGSLARDPATLKMFIQGQALATGAVVRGDALAAMEIEVMELDDQIMISSSPRLDEVIFGSAEELTWASVLAGLQEYSVDLSLSNSYSSDIVTVPSVAEVAASRMDLSISRAARTADQISAFEEMVFDDAHVFAESYNSGRINLDEALRAIDQSRKFREWMRSLSPDANLLHEYHRAISKDTIFGKLPASIARFTAFNGAGLAVDAATFPGAGVIISAIDSFVVQKLIGGWRPNVFVNNIKKLVEIDS